MNALLQRLAEVDSDLDVQTKEWRRQVQEMSYDIEDCIDDFMHRIGHNGMADSAGLVNKVVQQLKSLRVRHQIASQIQDLKARVEDASKRRMRYKLDESAFQSRTTAAIDPRLLSLYAVPEGLVGVGKPRDDIVQLLMQGEGASARQLKVVSVVGPGGLGKTTLVNEVYRRLESQFQCRAFVSLSQQPDVKKILRNILCQVSQQEHDNMEIWDEEKIINAIRDFLQRKRYLIVIDDIWSNQAWRTVKCALYANALANLRYLYIQSYYGYSIDFLLDSWFPTPHLLQTFGMGMEYHFPRIPFWIASLDNLICLDINVDPVEQKALDVLGNLPSLLYLWLTSKATALKERLIISSSMFICLKEFHFTCWSSGVGLMFEAGAMIKLEKLGIYFDAGAGLYFGFQHLSSLKHLVAEIICSSVTVQEVQALEEAIRSVVDLLPNHPTLEV
ncbi:unnamed protein product [Urochloa decumbens]|uniref:AAA+ ATPase domain-containing protein n=1 Tax=Urochloa decumbens TaxID=240449 RepID=A0ABC8VIT4_9POAL